MSKSLSSYVQDDFYNSFGHSGMSREKIENMFNNSQHDYVALARFNTIITGICKWA